MGAATLSIFYLRIRIEGRALLFAGVPGMIGVTLGTCFLASHVSPVLVRVLFTVLVSSMGIALLLMNRRKHCQRNEAIPAFRSAEKAVLISAGFVGGVVSSLIGTGENTVLFIVLVLLFRVNEKVVTPTTVILMTMVTVPGSLLHLLLLRDVTPTVMGYWLAAVPVAAAAAPFGALLCSRMKREAVVKVLLLLIALEIASTVLLVPITRSTLSISIAALAIFGAIELLMSRTRRYLPQNFSAADRLPENAARFVTAT